MTRETAYYIASLLERSGARVELPDMIDDLRDKFGADVDDRLRCYMILEGHIAYREFFMDGGQIEKRPAVLLLPGWLWDGFYADQRVKVTGVTYRIDEPLAPVEFDGIILYFAALAYRD